MEVVRDEAGLSRYLGGVVVPTMGALHAGHLSLIRVAREKAGANRPVVVTVFVNPTQFGPSEDFARYPRTLEADVAACREAGADAVFAPAPEVVYPPGREIRVPPLPEVAMRPGLEDSARPGHFAGVCQVVLRLLELTAPRAAVFGEKDWQQLKVVEAMVAREWGGKGRVLQIIASATVREPDGLAMSSRNRFLSAGDRQRGLALSRALCEACSASDPGAAERIMLRVLGESEIRPDYAVVRDATTLLPVACRPSERPRPMRALVAARVGPVRLIDNAPWTGARS